MRRVTCGLHAGLYAAHLSAASLAAVYCANYSTDPLFVVVSPVLAVPLYRQTSHFILRCIYYFARSICSWPFVPSVLLYQNGHFSYVEFIRPIFAVQSVPSGFRETELK